MKKTTPKYAKNAGSKKVVNKKKEKGDTIMIASTRKKRAKKILEIIEPLKGKAYLSNYWLLYINHSLSQHWKISGNKELSKLFRYFQSQGYIFKKQNNFTEHGISVRNVFYKYEGKKSV